MTTDTIKLIPYDNISRYLKEHQQEIQTAKQKEDFLEITFKDNLNTITRNFYEYSINGKMLINLIGLNYWSKDNSESFFDSKIGLIGSFGKFWDWIIINQLMIKSKSKEDLQKILTIIYPNMSVEDRNSKVKMTLDEFKYENNNNEVLIYGCSVCGDENCGGIAVQIFKNKSYYHWDFGDEKLKFRFDKSQYENEFNSFLKYKGIQNI